MNKPKWTGLFVYDSNDLMIEGVFPPKIDIIVLSAAVAVMFFSLTGGADRKIELATANDMSLSSELEQARSYKNIRLFLSPTESFAGSELMQIALKKLKLTITIVVNCRVGTAVTQSVMLYAKNAVIAETPHKLISAVNGAEYLFVNLKFDEAQLNYLSPKGKEMAAEKW